MGSEFEKHVRSMRDPRDYFQGLSDPQSLLPTNVLLFHRHKIDVRSRSHHHRYVLIWNLRLAANVIVDDTFVRLEPGQALLIFPHQFHSYQSETSAKCLWLFVTFELERGGVSEALRGCPVSLSVWAQQLASALVETWRKIQSKANDTTRAARLALLTGLLLHEMSAAVPEQEALTPRRLDRFDQLLSRVCQYVQAHMDEGARIKNVAQKAGVSESHLRLLFRTRMGVSLGQYLQSIRMQRATRLLTGSTLSVEEISTRCGYGSIYAFSRAFKHELRVSPSHYRKQHRE